MCAGVASPVVICPDGDGVACQRPIACHPVLPPDVSPAARYWILFPANAGLKVMLRPSVNAPFESVAESRLTAHWLFWIAALDPSDTDPAYGPPASPASSTSTSVLLATTYAR